MAPFHSPQHDPLRTYGEDLELVVRMDELGFDEAWFGEHHSSGWETVPSPEIFMAVAAERTRSIRLGAGVVSVSYHHPFHVAERMTFLDQLTRGRVILGVGPGSLSGDAMLLGIDPATTRIRLSEGLDAIMALLRAEGPVTRKTS
jgi:limonene 1,2-monooxygenase